MTTSRPWLVMLNSSRTALAPTAFNAIITAEITFSIIGLVCMPLVSEAVYNAGVIHRNFRIQVRMISIMFYVTTLARFVLLYYQLFDVALDDSDLILVVADLVRDSTFGYICGMPLSFTMERSLATLFWKWYEKQTAATMAALFVIEFCNTLVAFINAFGWLFGYWQFEFNVCFLLLIVMIGVILFISMFTFNVARLRSFTVTIDGNYSLARTFQIRENVRIMKCLLLTGLPVFSVSSVGFSFFCYYEWAPREWRLSLYLSIALFDLFVPLFCLLFMVMTILMDSEFERQLHKLLPIRVFRRTFRMKTPRYRPSALKSVQKKQPDICTTTDLYFYQLKVAWMK